MRVHSIASAVDFFVLVVGLFVVILNELNDDCLVEAGDKGDDIILHKGKIIMRGGKGKGGLARAHYRSPTGRRSGPPS
jgi:hypothetical protein